MIRGLSETGFWHSADCVFNKYVLIRFSPKSISTQTAELGLKLGCGIWTLPENLEIKDSWTSVVYEEILLSMFLHLAEVYLNHCKHACVNF